jgi:hypothetical protein
MGQSFALAGVASSQEIARSYETQCFVILHIAVFWGRKPSTLVIVEDVTRCFHGSGQQFP